MLRRLHAIAHAIASTRRGAAALLRSLCAAGFAAVFAVGQAPAPGGSASPTQRWLREGADLLEREDPVLAWQAFRRAAEIGPPGTECHIGLGRAHLMLGRSRFALDYAEAAIGLDARNQDAMALWTRALIRARSFDDAVRSASSFLQRCPEPHAELLAARASALFRVQRTAEAAAAYRLVVSIDPLHAEGHLRLGSGLLGPSEVRIGPDLHAAVAAAQRGALDLAVAGLRAVLQSEPAHPVAHRLLGEVLLAQRCANSMATNDPAFAALAAALPQPSVRDLPVAQFVVGYEALSPSRRAVVDRAVALFRRQLPKLVAIGGTHDLLRELERTTDAASRRNLRGRRTFDGRVWDDVRGIGGIQAATGIEALDEAAQFGFDTLAHEIAHQAHLFSFKPVDRARIKSLYERALAGNRCLDYYAASNEAEYFGQGVEAFASLGKRPGGETTHGHTRFELYRVDRALHDFVASVVDHDPLRSPQREQVLAAAVAVALRCGRPEDALVAAGMLAPGPERERLLAEAGRAAAAAENH